MVIYKQYNQDQLDLQYNNRIHVPDYETYFTTWERLSRKAEKKYTVLKDIAYGNGPRECIDVFPSANSGSKTLIFIHGGYWQRFDKSLFHFVAGAFADYGITIVLLNYPLIPDVSIDEIVASCRKSLTWLKKNLRELNGDPLQMYIAGHSAGGHLAAMLLENRWAKNNLDDSIKGVCSLSGLFNLKPIQQSNLNSVLNLTREITERNSPVNLEPTSVGRLLLFVGSAETQEYKDQSEELFNTWKNKVSAIDFSEITGLNHFSILNSILDPFSLIHHSICKMMQL